MVRRHPSLVLLVLLAGLAPGTGEPASPPSEPAPAAIYGESGPLLRLATGSPGELGLIEALAVAFGEKEPAQLAWYKAGSGAALELLRTRNVDLVMVHAPAAEQRAVEAGWAARRTLVGGNAYYLVGPLDDPASIRDSHDVLDAFQRIATAEVKFLSRGDQSGTHREELAFWEAAGFEPDWAGYYASGDFMAASLRMANRDGAYFLTDNSTWVALRAELDGLAVLFSDDPRLLNVYHALISAEGDAAARKLAERFVDFVSGPAGQAAIRAFGRDRYGASLYLDASEVAGD
jgi:tungstate transport system substrate-binding protein